MPSRPFRLKLFTGPRTPTQFLDLHTVVRTGPERSESFDIITRAIGLKIDYGTLFAYLFRRFGYPNSGWDDYKELSSYHLSTPAPDMFMQVTPSVGNTSSISIMMMVSQAGWQALNDYDRKPSVEHAARMHDWIEAKGLPDWIGKFVEAAQRDFGAGLQTWRDAFPYFELYDRREATQKGAGADSDVTEEQGIPSAWLDWSEEMEAAYLAIEPRPGQRYRSENIETWTEDDPLKRYALAAVAALEDLSTPVRVRDSAINAFGRVENAKTVLKEPAVAGYPSGALGNAAPVEFSELHGLIMELGKGNAKRGIAKVMKACGR